MLAMLLLLATPFVHASPGPPLVATTSTPTASPKPQTTPSAKPTITPIPAATQLCTQIMMYPTTSSGLIPVVCYTPKPG